MGRYLEIADKALKRIKQTEKTLCSPMQAVEAAESLVQLWEKLYWNFVDSAERAGWSFAEAERHARGLRWLVAEEPGLFVHRATAELIELKNRRGDILTFYRVQTQGGQHEV